MKPDLDKILLSTDSVTGEPSVFSGWAEVEEMYSDLGWTSDPSDDGIMPIAVYIAQQHDLGLTWDSIDWLYKLRSLAGTALDAFTDDELIAAIENEHRRFWDWRQEDQS